MTSQVMPYRNFYSPSVLQESYLGCLFELGSLQEGRTPFLFKRPIRSRADDLRLYLEYLGGGQQVLLGVLLISLIESVSKAPSLLLTGPVHIDIFQRCHLYLIATLASCLPFSSLRDRRLKGKGKGVPFSSLGRRRISGRLMDFLG